MSEVVDEFFTRLQESSGFWLLVGLAVVVAVAALWPGKKRR